MFYWEFEDISKFLGIVLNAICSQVQSERSSDHVFVSICVSQTFMSHRVRRAKGFWLASCWSELSLVLLLFVGRSDYDVGYRVLSSSTATQRKAPKVRGYEPNDFDAVNYCMKRSPLRSELCFKSKRMSHSARRPAQPMTKLINYETKWENAVPPRATMVGADMKRRVLSRPVFYGEQEYAIISEMIFRGTYSKSRIRYDAR